MGMLQSLFKVQQTSPKQKGWSLILLMLFAVILYWPSLNYGFVLDDKKVITENAVTQGGVDSLHTIWASGSKTFQANVPDDAKIARPLSQTYFALCFDKNLSIEALQKRYHQGQIALYALLVFLLFFLLDKYFDHLSLGLRCVVLALFIAHPLHVEVVANIKSADELLASILLVSSLLALPYSKTSSTHRPAYRIGLIILSLFLFVLGYKAKQNILMFSPLLIALLFLDIYKTLPKTIQERGYSYRWHYGLPMVVVLLAILFYKGADNVPLVQIYALDFEVYQTIQSTYSKAHNTFLGMASTGEIVANSLWTTCLSVAKMIWPRDLVHQYGAFQIPLTSWQSIKPFCALGLGGILLAGMYWLSRGPGQLQRVMIGAALFTLPLIAYSHLFIPLPDTYADRFFFLAVLGMLLLTAEAISRTSLKPIWIIGLSALGLTAYSSKVIQRMPAWESDIALLVADWKQSPNNASILARYASHVEEDDDKKEQLYLEALSICPDFFGAHYDLARLYFSQQRYALAYKHFNQAIKSKASDDIQYNLALCRYHILRRKSQSAYASNQLEDAIQLLDSARSIFPKQQVDPQYREMTSNLAKMHFEHNAHDTAYELLIKALKQDSNHLVYAQEGLNMAGNAKNSSRAVEFGLYFAPSRADDLTYWTDLENLAQGNVMLLEQIKLRKSEIFSAR
jgi:tetratricopeptide (TPR) repeat protein